MNRTEQQFINQERISRKNNMIEVEIIGKLEVYKELFAHVSYHDWILRDSNGSVLLRVDFEDKRINFYDGGFPYIFNILEARFRERGNKLKARYNDLVEFNELLGGEN